MLIISTHPVGFKCPFFTGFSWKRPYNRTCAFRHKKLGSEEIKEVSTIIKTEEFPLHNCGGTSEVSQTVEIQSSVSEGLTSDIKTTETTGGEAGILDIIRGSLEEQIGDSYQQSRESGSFRSEKIELKSAPGTHVVYEIQWEEKTFSSVVSYKIKDKAYEMPYTYIRRIPKISGSYQEDCPSPTPSSP